jgi:Phospholipase_D-nuclease N-terminal
VVTMLMAAIVIFGVTLWIAILVSLLGNRAMTMGEKGIWLIVITFLPFLGPMAYMIAAPRSRSKM